MQNKYDALLLVSFGGPNGPDDVIPFLENVLRGKNVPKERMLAVAKHYDQFGGVSPINEQNKNLIKAIEALFKEKRLEMPVYWGNRNWHPMLFDTITQMKSDGIKNALYFVTSAYGSYSGCRQYRENVSDALKAVGAGAPQLEKLRLYFNHPGFIEANSNHLNEALNEFSEQERKDLVVLFSAHSIPQSMASGCAYKQQLEEACNLVADMVDQKNYQLVFQSRSGPPAQPWLEPDILDKLRELSANGVKNVIVLPIGFISDHLEVIYDLDTEAKQLAEELSLKFKRAKSVGVHPRFVNMIHELIEEKISGTTARFSGSMGLLQDQCNPDCCLYSRKIPTGSSNISKQK